MSHNTYDDLIEKTEEKCNTSRLMLIDIGGLILQLEDGPFKYAVKGLSQLLSIYNEDLIPELLEAIKDLNGTKREERL
jgi:hypothetical protein